MIKVLGIKIIDRIKEAGLTQGILSRYAGVITTRLGFHEVSDDVCSREAYIILHLKYDHSEAASLNKELESLGGILLREMVFQDDHTWDEETKIPGITEIIGLLVERDRETIAAVQRILTSYGCNIRTRLGVNETFFGDPAGLIILELKGDQRQRDLLEKDLSALGKVHVRKMMF